MGQEGMQQLAGLHANRRYCCITIHRCILHQLLFVHILPFMLVIFFEYYKIKLWPNLTHCTFHKYRYM